MEGKQQSLNSDFSLSQSIIPTSMPTAPTAGQLKGWDVSKYVYSRDVLSCSQNLAWGGALVLRDDFSLGLRSCSTIKLSSLLGLNEPIRKEHPVRPQCHKDTGHSPIYLVTSFRGKIFLGITLSKCPFTKFFRGFRSDTQILTTV